VTNHQVRRSSDSEPPTSRALRSVGVRPTKSLGQNFLQDEDVVRRMVDALEVSVDDVVIEVGPGLGILTIALLNQGARVTAIEIDPQLVAYMREKVRSPRLTVIEADALNVSIGSLLSSSSDYLFAANLPYSSAPAIVRRFLECEPAPKRMAIMVQREVAERMSASPGRMSVLSIAMQIHARARIVFDVPPEAFIPMPKVTSSVVMLEPFAESRVDPSERESFFRVVTAGFLQRRKTLLNALENGLNLDREFVRSVLGQSNVEPARRAQTLSVDEWLAVVANLNELEAG
jgi:16S rRNA (adenine1518-N6/adenine1519-N6)-dimethyltransferase